MKRNTTLSSFGDVQIIQLPDKNGDLITHYAFKKEAATILFNAL